MVEKTKQLSDKEHASKIDFRTYQIPTDKKTILCIDERPKEETIQGAVRLPGAVYGLIDAIKAVGHFSEKDAWNLAKERGIPMDAHTDDHHQEGNEGEGCGYGATVQHKPEVLGVVESIPANERIERAKTGGGRVFHYTGGHRPTHAILNYVPDTTIDQQQAWNDGLGLFVCDLWAVPDLAHRLGLDSTKMTDFMTALFKNTVNHLAPGTPFVELHELT